MPEEEERCPFVFDDGRQCDQKALFQEEYCWEHLPDDRKAGFRDTIEKAKRELESANLRCVDLSGLNLRCAKLSGANLSEACLAGADLSGRVSRRESGAVLVSHSDLSGANITGADLRGANLSSASLKDADLTLVRLSKATLHNTDLNGACLFRADLAKASLVNADAAGVELFETNLAGADFASANLAGAKFTGTNISGANFRNANLDSAVMFGINDFRRADFIEANVVDMDYVHSALLKRHVEDQLYIHEFRHAFPLLYWFWKLLCDCGRNVWLWMLWSVFFIALFGGFFSWFASEFDVRSVNNIFTPYYFSVITFTTLGFGDVIPLSLRAQILVALEVIVGYVMLGGLVSLLAVRLARRA